MPSSTALSSIPDEGYPQQVESEWGADVLRTVGAIVDANKRQREEESGTHGEDEAGRPETMVAGGNKRLKVRRAFSTLKKRRSEEVDGTCVSEKENVCVETKRGSGKWEKVGGLRGEAVMRGLRSLFH